MMSMYRVVVQLLLLLGVASLLNAQAPVDDYGGEDVITLRPGKATSSCNCIALRIDDIQDYWIIPAQIGMMDLFQTNNIPLTIGIISNFFGEDEALVDYIKDGLNNEEWDLEIANHGFNHEYFSTFTLAEQETLLQEGKAKILSVFGSLVPNVTTFVPPYNDFNNDTLTALANNGFRTMSSQTSLDLNPTPSDPSTPLFHWPIGAATCNMTVSPQLVGVDAAYTFSQIQQQMEAYGYAAVMMHPEEFCDLDDTLSPTNNISAHMFQQLQALIAMIQQAGYRFVTIGEIADSFNGEVVGSVLDPNQKLEGGTDVNGNFDMSANVTFGGNGTGSAAFTTGGAQATSGVIGTTSGGLTNSTTNSTTNATATSGRVSTASVTTSAPKPSCDAGSLNCPCTSEDSCSSGLVCDNGICISTITIHSSDSAQLFGSMMLIAIASFVAIIL